jgi:hypothetical protein
MSNIDIAYIIHEFINKAPIPYNRPEPKKPVLKINSFFFKRLEFLSEFVIYDEELLDIAKANHIVNDDVAKAVIDLYNNNTKNIHKKNIEKSKLTPLEYILQQERFKFYERYRQNPSKEIKEQYEKSEREFIKQWNNKKQL